MPVVVHRPRLDTPRVPDLPNDEPRMFLSGPIQPLWRPTAIEFIASLTPLGVTLHIYDPTWAEDPKDQLPGDQQLTWEKDGYRDTAFNPKRGVTVFWVPKPPADAPPTSGARSAEEFAEAVGLHVADERLATSVVLGIEPGNPEERVLTYLHGAPELGIKVIHASLAATCMSAAALVLPHA